MSIIRRLAVQAQGAHHALHRHAPSTCCALDFNWVPCAYEIGADTIPAGCAIRAGGHVLQALCAA
eukprot:14828200-Alexandrium_andersonii.AAC.1